MKIETTRKIRITLLVFAIIIFLGSLSFTGEAKLKKATDTSNIIITITEKNTHSKRSEMFGTTTYYIDLNYKIENKTKVGWSSLNITTHVYDKSGKHLGDLQTAFDQYSGFRLEVGGTAFQKTTWEGRNNDSFFNTLLPLDISELEFVSEVTSGKYYK